MIWMLSVLFSIFIKIISLIIGYSEKVSNSLGWSIFWVHFRIVFQCHLGIFLCVPGDGEKNNVMIGFWTNKCSHGRPTCLSFSFSLFILFSVIEPFTKLLSTITVNTLAPNWLIFPIIRLVIHSSYPPMNGVYLA